MNTTAQQQLMTATDRGSLYKALKQFELSSNWFAQKEAKRILDQFDRLSTKYLAVEVSYLSHSLPIESDEDRKAKGVIVAFARRNY